jgi:putative ABC transport system permease protein
MTPARLRFVLLGVLAGLALALAAMGIYGVMAYSIAGRTREFGIRAALGASPANLMRLVVRQGLSLAALGLALGAAGAVGVTRLVRSVLFGIETSDAIAWAAAATILVCVAALACYIPARAAARVDPSEALRAD